MAVHPLPLPSALTNFISSFTLPTSDLKRSHTSPYLELQRSSRVAAVVDQASPIPPPSPYQALALSILHQLQYAHDWKSLAIHTISPLTGKPLPRPLVSGLPPQRIYVHPDEQVEILAREKEREKSAKAKATGSANAGGNANEDEAGGDKVSVEREWVVPTKLSEKWSLRKFAEVFDAVGEEPPVGDEDGIVDGGSGGGSIESHAKRRAGKRILLAVLGDDSTAVYYIVHEGIVKPRQN
ncbi:MAG: hypothetical protein MMC23_006539 [Stictis urceolatum]|nr:hypothetical protein [Stictis urceolata]